METIQDSSLNSSPANRCYRAPILWPKPTRDINLADLSRNWATDALYCSEKSSIVRGNDAILL